MINFIYIIGPIAWAYMFLNIKNILQKERLYDSSLSHKISNNILAGSHCYYTLLLLYFHYTINDGNYFGYIKFNTTSFYIYDAFRMIYYNYNKFGVSQGVMILHHVGTVLMLNGFTYCGKEFFVFGEMSNILLYPVYHFHTLKIKNKVLDIGRVLQLITYSIPRIFIFTYYYYQTILNDPLWISIPGFIMYMMGVYWSYRLYSDVLRVIY